LLNGKQNHTIKKNWIKKKPIKKDLDEKNMCEQWFQLQNFKIILIILFTQLIIIYKKKIWIHIIRF
jgi:hypothetical protein